MKVEDVAEQRTVQEEACLIHTLRFASTFLGILGMCACHVVDVWVVGGLHSSTHLLINDSAF